MRLLAVETATRRLSVALWLDGRADERVFESVSGGSEWLLPAAAGLLADAGLVLSDLDCLAFGRGPGAFTGLRLGVACVQGLAFGCDLPVIGVDSLAALADVCGEHRTYACLDARMGEVYVAAYEGGQEVIPPTVSPPASVPQPPGEGWVGCGDGFAVHGEVLPRMPDRRPGLLPTAVAVARLAARQWAAGCRSTAAEALPLYVRDKVALTTAERLARGGLR